MNTHSSKDAAKASTPEALSNMAQALQAQARAVLGKVPLLGQVTWLMMQQAATRHTLVSELEWRVMPPLVLDQAKLYVRDGAPIAFVSWALLSASAAERYRGAPHQLGASDWKSGDEVWLIDLFTPFGGAADVLKDLRNEVFAGRQIHQLAPSGGETAKVITWPAVQR